MCGGGGGSNNQQAQEDAERYTEKDSSELPHHVPNCCIATAM